MHAQPEGRRVSWPKNMSLVTGRSPTRPAQAMRKELERTNRLIVGGRAHKKPPGLS